MKRLQTTYSRFVFHGPAAYAPHHSYSTKVYRITCDTGTLNLTPSEATSLARDILRTCTPPKE